MLVNLLLQDGKSNYMEGLMRESTGSSEKRVLTVSDVALPRHRTLLHSLVIIYNVTWRIHDLCSRLLKMAMLSVSASCKELSREGQQIPPRPIYLYLIYTSSTAHLQLHTDIHG